MLKKIFKAAKKAAPIIGAGLGFLAGGPVLGSAIGGGLGSLVAGRSPQEALKFAALSGYPNITIPMGFIDYLPVGLSFFGRKWSEPKLIEIAYAYEKKTNFRAKPQYLPTD